jgi:hypothetical protein
LFVSIIRNNGRSDETRGRTEETVLEVKNKMNRQKKKNIIRRKSEELILNKKESKAFIS